MLKQIKNVWLFSKNRFINTLLWVSLAAVITGLLVFLIVKVFGANDPDMTYIHMMSLMAYIVLWAAILLTGMTDFGKCFDMMVGMGRTRKEFFLSYGVLNFGTYLIYAAEILLIAWLETVIEKVCYAGIPCEMNLTFFFFDVRIPLFTSTKPSASSPVEITYSTKSKPSSVSLTAYTTSDISPRSTSFDIEGTVRHVS